MILGRAFTSGALDGDNASLDGHADCLQRIVSGQYIQISLSQSLQCRVAGFA